MKYFFTFSLVIIASCLFAQKGFQKNLSGMNSNAFYISGTPENELWFFYERIFKGRNAIEIGYGKKWGSEEENPLSLETNQAQFYAGNIFMGNYKRYLYFRPGKHPYYFSGLFFIKNYTFSPIDIVHIYDNHSSTCETRSSQKQVYGLKFLLGRRLNIRIGDQFSFLVDIYTGLGVRARIFNDLIYKHCYDSGPNVSCNCAPYSEPMKDNHILFAPSFHLGVKVGFGIF